MNVGFLFGLVPVILFILIRTGIFKSWAILPTLPGLMSARMFYACLPLGLGFMLGSFLPSLPNYDINEKPFFYLFLLAFLGGPLLGFWFMYRPPKWIVPGWMRWLEQEYGYCADILLEEAQFMNRWDWEWQVRTRQGMQQWIDSIYLVRQEEIDFAWQVEKLYRVEQQNLKKKIYALSPGMKVEGEVPVHRQDDIALIREEIDAVVAIQNAKYRPDKSYQQKD